MDGQAIARSGGPGWARNGMGSFLVLSAAAHFAAFLCSGLLFHGTAGTALPTIDVFLADDAGVVPAPASAPVPREAGRESGPAAPAFPIPVAGVAVDGAPRDGSQGAVPAVPDARTGPSPAIAPPGTLATQESPRAGVDAMKSPVPAGPVTVSAPGSVPRTVARPGPGGARPGDSLAAAPQSAGSAGPGVGQARPAGSGTRGTGPGYSLLRAAIQSRIVYPEDAIRRGQEGEVLLRIRIGEDGRPGDIRVARSSGSRSLDEAARRGVVSAAPLPSEPGWVEVPVFFRLH